MNKPLVLKLLLSTVIFLPFTQSAYADCAVTGATGTGGEVVVCSAADADGYDGTAFGDEVTVPAGATVDNTADTINADDGDDLITISGGDVTTSSGDAVNGGNGEDTIIFDSGSITASSDGIQGDNDNDTITMNGGTITSGDQGIQGNAGDDVITLNGGTIDSTDEGIRGDDGDDTITVNGGTITSAGDEGITGDDGNDVITVNGGTITAGGIDPAIDGEQDDDTIIIGGDVIIVGDIDGGTETDTLSFAMTVPTAELIALQLALAAADPAAGTIDINGNTYTWLNFEVIEDNLRVSDPAAIPTLQEWALILLIALLGLFGFGYTRKTGRSF